MGLIAFLRGTAGGGGGCAGWIYLALWEHLFSLIWVHTFLLVSFFALCACSRLWAAGHNWMASIDGEKFLHELSIPGAHDTGALIESVSGTAKCQNLTIEEQLQAGVRFLDIRCRHIGDAFVIHHGQVYQELNFTDVLQSVANFLQANPSETVIMSVKEEYTPEGNTRSFAETFTAYVGTNPSIWSLGSEVPKLNDVRSKIVLLRRFNDPDNRGIAAPPSVWPDDSTGTVAGPPRIRIQDVYKVWDRGNKWSYITSLFSEMPGNPGTLYLNFISGYSPWTVGIPDIPHVARHINPLLESYFTKAPPRPHGIVIMDFVTARLAELVYRTNFPPAASVRRLVTGSVDPDAQMEVSDGNVYLTWKDWDSEPFIDANGNGVADTGEPFTDVNSNSRWDIVIDRRSDIEVSSDLSTWSPLVKNAGSGHVLVAASSASAQESVTAPTATKAFYRVKSSSMAAPTSAMVVVQGGILPEASSLTGTAVETFLIGNCEVRFDEWSEVRAWALANGYTDLALGEGGAGNHAVGNVSWFDAAKWCNARSEKEGLTPVYQVSGAVYRTGESEPTLNATANGYRLPSEGEWEWAARGGVSSKGYIYSGSNDVNAVAIHFENCGGVVPYLLVSSGIGRGPWPVGSKAANELGIYDMSGNLLEWFGMRSGWLTPDSGNLRGGSWRAGPSNCLIHLIAWLNPALANANTGFRVARNAP